MNKLNYNLVLGLLLALSSGQAAYANPTGAEVINGQVSFSHPDANTLNITNSNGAVINWQQFSIQQNEITRFIQDSANSAVLNRIVGQDPSALLGQLLSNGRVFLINPNGILFGPNSVIDTAGLIASTLDMTDEDFINQNLTFQGDNAADIQNQGYIKTGENGDIFLIAPNIENSGIIETDGGEIILAAGESVTIAGLDSDYIVFDVQAPENEAVNLGEMITNGGAAKMFAGTIKQAGAINANSISVDENGNVQLFAQADIEITSDAMITANGSTGGEIKVESNTGTVWNSGTIEAKGEEGQGGHVEVLGERVALLDEASIDASGKIGGGEILVGGDYQGKNIEVKNAMQTYINKDTSIKADAITSGDGGKVIVWADETTQFYGEISAKGGSESGDGGFVETSGKEYLEATGIVNASARNGAIGEWLLDPNNITIQTAGPDTNITGNPAFTTTNDSSILTTGTIETALNGGTSVTVTTSSLGANSQVGNITVNNTITKTAGGNASLTLTADNDININSSISSTVGTLDIILDANTTSGIGVINIGSITISGNGGTFDTSGDTVNLNGNLTLASNWTSTSSVKWLGITAADDFVLNAGTTFTNQSLFEIETINAGAEISGAGTFSNEGSVTKNSSSTVTTTISTVYNSTAGSSTDILSGAGNLSLANGGSHVGNYTVIAGSVFQFTGGNHSFNSGSAVFGSGDIAFTGGLTIFNAGSGYAISGDTGINGGDVSFIIAAVTNSLTHVSNTLGGTGSITTSNWNPTGGNVDINSLVLGAGYFGTLSSTVSGTGTITNQGALTLNGGTINPAFINQGIVSVTGGSSLAGTATQSSGITFVNGGATLTTATLNINGGVLYGDGTIAGTVNNNGGLVTPGNILGTLNITGNYTQAAGGAFQADLGGVTTAGIDYDLLNVTGNVALAGTLDIQLSNGFTVSIGDQFDIINASSITGDFSNVTVPILYSFINTPNIPGVGNYQIEAGAIGATVDATNDILALGNFQDELERFFSDDVFIFFSSDEEGDGKKLVLACQ